MEEKKVKIKKPIYKRWWFWVIAIIFVIGALSGPSEEPATESNNAKLQSKAKDVLEFDGDMKLSVDGKDVVIELSSNVPDGGLFEVAVMNGAFQIVSDFIPIEDGVINKSFTLPDDWKIGYISGVASLRFNLDEYPQPDSIKGVYGEKGEKLTGDKVTEANDGSKSATISSEIIAYPDEETVKAKQDELFSEALSELKSLSNGIIIDVMPYFEKDDWSAVAVIVSDAWYNSAEYEKERFAEQLGETIGTIVKNTGRVESDKTVNVYLFDSFNKKLAEPKILGGYKILR